MRDQRPEVRDQNFAPLGEAMRSKLLECGCELCKGRPLVEALRPRIIEAYERQIRRVMEFDRSTDAGPEPYILPEHVHALRILARHSEPVHGEIFEKAMGVDARRRKEIMRDLRDEWLLPVCATRQKPFGYFIAQTAAQFNEWMETTRSQAVSELRTAYRVFRVNFPELAGQQRLAIVNAVDDGLKEAA